MWISSFIRPHPLIESIIPQGEGPRVFASACIGGETIDANKDIARHLEGKDLSSGTVAIPSQRGRERLRSFLHIILGVLLTLGIWWIFAAIYNGGNATLAFPTPIETFQRMGEYFFDGRSLYGQTIYEHTFASLGRLFTAFGLAAVFGITVGCLLGFYTRIYTIGMVPVSVFQMIPGLAWLPIAILVFGLGDEAAVFIIFAVSSMVITVGVASGIRMVPPVLVSAARMMGANPARIFFTVLVPQASVSIISALRVGMSSAFRVLIAAEMVVGTGIGLGYSIELTRDLLDYTGAFACIAVICIIGLIIDRLVLAGIERGVRRRLGLEGD